MDAMRRPRVLRRSPSQFRVRRAMAGTVPGPRESRPNGQAIYVARYAAGLTQYKLADLLHVQQSDVSAMEHELAWITPESAATLADVLTKALAEAGVRETVEASALLQGGDDDTKTDVQSSVA
jgi:ribosome-binding protein aMBF1 (putative translation factor)